MIPRLILTDSAPAPVGPYSQAVECGDLIFISGQIAIDTKTGQVSGSTVREQAALALKNLKAILGSQGLGTGSLVKTTVFLRDMNSFADFNEVYKQELEGACPARSVVEVSGLPKNVLVEIEAVACR
jgi:2-iminobutanoate/2-iminopropanoate deaminase